MPLVFMVLGFQGMNYGGMIAQIVNLSSNSCGMGAMLDGWEWQRRLGEERDRLLRLV
jgi:hypothetical protein